MNNKGVGAIFCLIAAILLAAQYVSAAIFMSGVQTWSAEHFRSALQYVGPSLPIAAAAALIAGVIFLVSGLIQDRRNKNSRDPDQ